MLLGTKRTVTARADSHKVVANIIPKDYFVKLKNNDLVLSALIRKTQVRLMDANEKINQLANEVSELLFRCINFLIILVEASKKHNPKKQYSRKKENMRKGPFVCYFSFSRFLLKFPLYRIDNVE